MVTSLFVALLAPTPVVAQQKDKTAASLPTTLLKRTTTRRETRRFAFGGTITVIGAPRGAVTIEGWSRAMDLRDRETAGHTERVTKLALDLARAMGLDEARIPLRDGDRQPGPDRLALARPEHGALARGEIEARVAGVGALGQRRLGTQACDRQLDHVVSALRTR